MYLHFTLTGSLHKSAISKLCTGVNLFSTVICILNEIDSPYFDTNDVRNNRLCREEKKYSQSKDSNAFIFLHYLIQHLKKPPFFEQFFAKSPLSACLQSAAHLEAS
jgi:hypothetical protein